MQLQEMYSGAVNSNETFIASDITETDTEIYVQDGAILPDAPNLLVIGGYMSNAETVKLIDKQGNKLTVQRAFQGMANAWEAGITIARNFTEADYRTLIENICGINEEVETHTEETLTSENGVHGIRYYEDTLQIYVGGEWIDIQVSGGGNSAYLGVAILGNAYLGG